MQIKYEEGEIPFDRSELEEIYRKMDAKRQEKIKKEEYYRQVLVPDAPAASSEEIFQGIEEMLQETEDLIASKDSDPKSVSSDHVRKINKNTITKARITKPNGLPDSCACVHIQGTPSNLIIINDKNFVFRPPTSEEPNRNMILNGGCDFFYGDLSVGNSFRFSFRLNPLAYTYDKYFAISDESTYELVDLIMKHFVKDRTAFKEAILRLFIYYILEEDEEMLKEGFPVAVTDDSGNPLPYRSRFTEWEESDGYQKILVQKMPGGKCLNTLLRLLQEAKVNSDYDEKSVFALRIEDFFRRHSNDGKEPKSKLYYDTFKLADYIEANRALLDLASSLQYFAAAGYDNLTRTDHYDFYNFDFDKILMQPSNSFYLDLAIPDPKVMQFFADIVVKILSRRKKELYGLWFIGYCHKQTKIPLNASSSFEGIFGPFFCKEDAVEFYETATSDDSHEISIGEKDPVYTAIFDGRRISPYYSKEDTLLKMIENIGEMNIWQGYQGME